MAEWTRRAFLGSLGGMTGLSSGCRAVFSSEPARTGTPTATPESRTLTDLHRTDAWDGWEEWGGDMAVDEGTAMDGDRSLHVAADGDADRAGVRFRFTAPQDLSERFPVLRFKWDPTPPYDKGSVGCRLADGAGRTAVFGQHSFPEFAREDAWHRLAPTFRPTDSDAGFDFADVVRLDLYHYTGGAYPAAFWTDEVRFVRSRLDTGAVMIHFDDANTSVYETAYPVMKRHGIPGTFNVISGNVGPGENLAVRNLREMADDGWTIGSHPQSKRALPEMDDAELREAIETEVTFLSANGFTPTVLAWPYNEWDARAVDIAGDYFEFGFAGGSGPHTYPPAPGTELTYPRTGGDPARHRALVDHARRRNGLLALTYHGAGRGHVPVGTFTDIVEHVATTDVAVLTASDLLGAGAGNA